MYFTSIHVGEILPILAHTQTPSHCTQTHISLWSTFTHPISLITATGVCDSWDTEGSMTVAHLSLSPLLLRNKNIPPIWFTVSHQHTQHSVETTTSPLLLLIWGLISDQCLFQYSMCQSQAWQQHGLTCACYTQAAIRIRVECFPENTVYYSFPWEVWLRIITQKMLYIQIFVYLVPFVK